MPAPVRHAQPVKAGVRNSGEFLPHPPHPRGDEVGDDGRLLAGVEGAGLHLDVPVREGDAFVLAQVLDPRTAFPYDLPMLDFGCAPTALVT